MNLTARFIDTCLGSLRPRIGAAATAAARRCLIDSLAVAYAAYGEPPIDMLRELSTAEASGGPSSVIAYGERARATDAALVNGMMISLQLFDDNQEQMRGHPSAPLWPAVLALGEQCDLTLAQALEAFVIGYEVECRFGLLLNPSHYEQGWHATATQGALASVIASALVLGLDADRTAHAVGIVASMASGLRRNFGTMTMSLHSGLAASDGVRAALLARQGFTADPSILDGPRGFGDIFSREWSADALAADLDRWGLPFMLVDPGPTFKLFPCGRPTLFGVDAALALRQRHGITASDVRRITCDVSYMFPRTLIHARPVNGLQGKTSLEYCIAVTLLDGRPTLASFEDAAVMRAPIRELIERIEIRVPPELSEAVAAVRKSPFEQPVTVTVETHDGRTVSETVAVHKGSPRNAASDADLDAKFADCAGAHLDAARVADILAYVSGADATVRGLMARLPVAGAR
jgi:2-methylcitrate dehydratase PrpD